MKKKITDFIAPIKTRRWVIKNGCSCLGTSENGKWDFYWFGNFSTGYQVKVRNW